MAPLRAAAPRASLGSERDGSDWREAETLFTSRERRSFVLRKLHSLTGVVPVGVFLLLHLWTNTTALQGQRAFTEAHAVHGRFSESLFWELILVLLPLAFHAVYGVAIALRARPRLAQYPTSAQWGYVLQRVTGVAVLVFVVVHLYELRAQAVLGTLEPPDYFPLLCASLSSTAELGIPIRALFYLTGMTAAVFHFSYGLYGFCFSWGITGSRRSSNRMSLVFGVLGLVLFLMGASTVVYFATGSRLGWSWVSSSAGDSPISCQPILAGRIGVARPVEVQPLLPRPGRDP